MTGQFRPFFAFAGWGSSYVSENNSNEKIKTHPYAARIAADGPCQCCMHHFLP